MPHRTTRWTGAAVTCSKGMISLAAPTILLPSFDNWFLILSSHCVNVSVEPPLAVKTMRNRQSFRAAAMNGALAGDAELKFFSRAALTIRHDAGQLYLVSAVGKNLRRQSE